MNNPAEKLKSILQSLTAIADKERSAVAKLAFDQISDLMGQKATLLAEFDEIAGLLEATELSEQLISELNNLRTRSEENAIILKAAVQGVHDARGRLKKLREADLMTGAYRADGGALRTPNASTITAKA